MRQGSYGNVLFNNYGSPQRIFRSQQCYMPFPRNQRQLLQSTHYNPAQKSVKLEKDLDYLKQTVRDLQMQVQSQKNNNEIKKYKKPSSKKRSRSVLPARFLKNQRIVLNKMKQKNQSLYEHNKNTKYNQSKNLQEQIKQQLLVKKHLKLLEQKYVEQDQNVQELKQQASQKDITIQNLQKQLKDRQIGIVKGVPQQITQNFNLEKSQLTQPIQQLNDQLHSNQIRDKKNLQKRNPMIVNENQLLKEQNKNFQEQIKDLVTQNEQYQKKNIVYKQLIQQLQKQINAQSIELKEAQQYLHDQKQVNLVHLFQYWKQEEVQQQQKEGEEVQEEQKDNYQQPQEQIQYAKFCSECGTKFTSSAKFCSNCGAKRS